MSSAINAVVYVCLSCALGCFGTRNGGGSEEPRFLQNCSQGAKCADGLECVCGVCTVQCDENDRCKAQSELAGCMPSDCSEERICDVECVEDEDCDELGSKYICENGRCRVVVTEAKDAETNDSSPNDGGISDGERNDSGTTPEPCLGTDRADEIARFILSRYGGMPVLCSEGITTFDGNEIYEVDFTEATIAYTISINCEPTKVGKVVMTDEETSRVQSALVELEPQYIDGCTVDYGEGTLSIPGCGDYKSEMSDSVCYDSTVRVIPIGDFSLLERMLREISLANHSATESTSCPPGCTVITARPVTDCVEPPRDFVPEDWKVACECSGENSPGKMPQCWLRLSDNSAWHFAAGELANPEAWGECAEEQVSASSVSCDFRDCEQPPPTTCGSLGWCDTVDCGGLQYDQRGCSRKSCDGDSDCKDDERCVALYCLDTTECDDFEPDKCLCINLEICIFGGVCNPVSIVGPRGEWQRIEVIQTGVCAPELNCDSRWTVFPDGQVDYDKTGVTGTATMNPNELWSLDQPRSQLIDGPELRVALRDGIECGFPLDGATVSVRLVLEGQTLEREISDCILGPEGNVFQRVYDLVTAY